jgi:hypothetical protein
MPSSLSLVVVALLGIGALGDSAATPIPALWIAAYVSAAVAVAILFAGSFAMEVHPPRGQSVRPQNPGWERAAFMGLAWPIVALALVAVAVVALIRGAVYRIGSAPRAASGGSKRPRKYAVARSA